MVVIYFNTLVVAAAAAAMRLAAKLSVLCSDELSAAPAALVINVNEKLMIYGRCAT